MIELTQEQIALWAARCKAFDAAHKHQWREPWASRSQKAQEEYDQAVAGVDEGESNGHSFDLPEVQR
jgi:hypothetical protein